MPANVHFPARRRGDRISTVLHGVLLVAAVAAWSLVTFVAVEVYAKKAKAPAVYIAQ